MTNNTEDIFKTMNASRVLVAILNKIGSIEIPTEDFIKSNSEDTQLSVVYNDESLSFEFKLESKNSESDDELANN
jgi:hypothetical protein